MATEQDVFAEQQALQRRRALMDAMTQQNMQSPIVGNTGLGQALAKLGTAYVLKNGQSNVDSQSAANRDRYNSELASGLQTYLNQRNGSPERKSMSTAEANDLMTNDVAPNMNAQPGNPRAAILGAMTSKFPELQSIGKAEFAQLGKTETNYKEHLTQDGTLVRTYPDGRTQVVGNFAKPKDKFTDPYTIKGGGGRDILVKRNLVTNEVEPVDKGVNVTTNVDTTGNKEALKKVGDVLESSRNAQIQSIQARQSSEQLLALAKDPEVITGFGAGPLGGLQALSAKLGFTGEDAAAKTQALVSTIAAQTLEASKELKGAISEKEKPFLEQAKAGSMNYTPQALQHLANLSMAVAHNTSIRARQQWESASRVTGANEIAKMYPQPELGSWEPGPEFASNPDGTIRYNPGLTPADANGRPQPAAPVQGTPSHAPLDKRIRFQDLKN
jgi:hypothetical protein